MLHINKTFYAFIPYYKTKQLMLLNQILENSLANKLNRKIRSEKSFWYIVLDF